MNGSSISLIIDKNLMTDCYNVDASESKVLAVSFMLYIKVRNKRVNIMIFCWINVNLW